MVDILDAAQNTVPPTTPAVSDPTVPPTPPDSSEPIEPPPAPPDVNVATSPDPHLSNPPVSPDSDSFVVPPAGVAPPQTPTDTPAEPDASAQPVPPPSGFKPAKKKINPAMIITGILLLFITIPLAGLVVKNSTEIRSMAAKTNPNDIGNPAARRAAGGGNGPIALTNKSIQATNAVIQLTNAAQAGGSGGTTSIPVKTATTAPTTSIPKITLNCNAVPAVARNLCLDGNDPAPLDMNKVNAALTQIQTNTNVGNLTGLDVIPSGAPSANGRNAAQIIIDNVCGTDATCIHNVTLTLGSAGITPTTTSPTNPCQGKSLSQCYLGGLNTCTRNGDGTWGYTCSTPPANGSCSTADGTTTWVAPYGGGSTGGTFSVCCGGKSVVGSQYVNSCPAVTPTISAVGDPCSGTQDIAFCFPGTSKTCMRNGDGKTWGYTCSNPPANGTCSLADNTVTWVAGKTTICCGGRALNGTSCSVSQVTVTPIPTGTCRSVGAKGPNGLYGCAGWGEVSSGITCSTVAQAVYCTKPPGGATLRPTIPGGTAKAGGGSSGGGTNPTLGTGGGISPTTAPQCVSIVVYKNGNVLSASDLNNLQQGDMVTFGYAPGGASTKVRFQVNGGSWFESTTKNSSGQFVWNYTLGSTANLTINAQWFDGTNWNN